MAKPYDLSKPLVALDHDSTLVAVVEMSGTSWLVLAIVPGIDRRPLQKLPVDENRLFRQLEIWRRAVPMPWCNYSLRCAASGSRQRRCWCMKYCLAIYAIAGRWRATPD